MNALQPTHAGSGGDGFVTRLNADGSALVYSTYIGGTGIDRGNGIAVDAAGNAYVTGSTQSQDFPLSFRSSRRTAGSSGTRSCSSSIPAGSAFVYSTYLGGSGSDEGLAIAVDGDGNAFVAGITASDRLSDGNPDSARAGAAVADGFVSKLNTKGSALVYSTYLGGSDLDFVTGIAVDARAMSTSPDRPVHAIPPRQCAPAEAWRLPRRLRRPTGCHRIRPRVLHLPRRKRLRPGHEHRDGRRRQRLRRGLDPIERLPDCGCAAAAVSAGEATASSRS